MPAGFRIRRATMEDLEVLVYHRRRMWKDIGIEDRETLDSADAVYRRWARHRLKSGRLVGFLAETRAGRVVAGGCVWLREVQPRPGRPDPLEPYLLSMFTEPEFRRRGLATRIVNEVIRWAREERYSRMTLHAADLGRGVYRKIGFEPTTEMRYRLQRRTHRR